MPCLVGRDFVDCKATRYIPEGTELEFLWGGGGFSAPVQTGHRAHAASCALGTGSLSWP